MERIAKHLGISVATVVATSGAYSGSSRIHDRLGAHADRLPLFR